MPSIELYAELLSNIRTITFVATLQTSHNGDTRVELSADGSGIAVSHEGESASMNLPTRMRGGGTAALVLPPVPTKDLTLRLALEEKEPGLFKIPNGSENVNPWPAASFKDAAVQCRGCGSDLLKPGAINDWRDLPSEDWADTMDFWHCHKPHEGIHSHQHGDLSLSKGYGSANKLHARNGIGFVGTSNLLVAEQDCQNLNTTSEEVVLKETKPRAEETTSSNLESYSKNVPTETPSRRYESPDKEPESISEADTPSSLSGESIVCTECGLAIGYRDKAANGWALEKWSLKVIDSAGTVREDAVEKWIVARLLSLIEGSGVRKIIAERGRLNLHSAEYARDGPSKLNLWVFTENLLFSSSHDFASRADPTRAMKIFWQPVYDSDPRSPDLLAPSTPDNAATNFALEHLILPDHIFQALHGALHGNESLLPASVRRFQQWRVSLLMRFGHVECGLELQETGGQTPVSPVEPFAAGEKVDVMKIPGVEGLLE